MTAHATSPAERAQDDLMDAWKRQNTQDALQALIRADEARRRRLVDECLEQWARHPGRAAEPT